jgi:hypothetical protein
MTETRATNEAAGVAAVSIIVQLLRTLEENATLSRRDVDNLLLAAYEGQADVAGVPRTALNAAAQKLISEVIKQLQID